MSTDLESRERRVRTLLLVGTALLVLVILINLVLALLKERRDILANAQGRAQNLVQLIEEQTAGSLAAVEVALAGTAATAQMLPRDGRTRAADIHELLLDSVRALPFVRAIWILDAGGNMIHDSESLPGKYNLSEREYFRVHRDNPSQGVYVDGPILSKHGVWFIGISRRIEARGGGFGGVVVAALEPKYLQRFYGSINVGEEGVLALYRSDGTLMVRAPATPHGIGQKASPEPRFVEALRDSPSGMYRASSALDGVARIYAYRALEGKPLVVAVGLGEAENLAGWWALARAYGLASAVFVAALVWLGYLLMRELTRRSALARALALDVAARKHAEALLEGQRRALELVAVGAPLTQTLDTLIRTVEEQAPEMLGSILLLDADGVHLHHGAAPSLPAQYLRAIDGEVIGEGQGSCGTAAYRRAAVIVEDIASDPLWENYRAFAAPHGLRACWSTPIFDAQQRVLGTFAMYFRTPQRPTERHRRLITIATDVAAIAIARSLEELQLRELVSQLRHLSRRLIEVEETERCSINRELHDRIGQNLSTLNLNLNLLRAGIPEGGENLRSRIDDARKLLESTIVEVRNIMGELHPPALDDFGLLAAMRTLAESLRAQTGLTVEVHGEDLEPRLPPAVEVSLFRIAQEALANAAKHSSATRVELRLEDTARHVRLTIVDEGTGFDPGRLPATKASWGIAIMRQRAEAVGAAFNVDSAPGRGTRVVVEILREAA